MKTNFLETENKKQLKMDRILIGFSFLFFLTVIFGLNSMAENNKAGVKPHDKYAVLLSINQQLNPSSSTFSFDNESTLNQMSNSEFSIGKINTISGTEISTSLFEIEKEDKLNIESWMTAEYFSVQSADFDEKLLVEDWMFCETFWN